MPLTIDDLCKAIKNRDIRVITNCLNESVDINARDAKGCYPIEWLSKTEEKSQNQEIENESSALEVLDILLPYKPNCFLKNKKGKYVLDALLKKQWHRAFEKIINHLNVDSDLTEIVLGDDEDSEESDSFISYWSRTRNPDSEDDLDGLPLFFYIIMHGQKEDIQIFINYIQKKNIDIRVLFEKKYKGQDPLIFSIEHERFDIMGLLLELGANPDTVDDNNVSAFQLLVFQNDLPAVKEFLKFNPDVNHIDQFGQSCLHQIALVGASKVLDVVLPRISTDEYNRRSKSGKTPLFVALEKIIEIQKEFFEERYNGISADDIGDDFERIGERESKQADPFFSIIKQLLLKWVDSAVLDNRGRSALTLASEIKASVVEPRRLWVAERRRIQKQAKLFEFRKEVLSHLQDGKSSDFLEAFNQHIDAQLHYVMDRTGNLRDTRSELKKHLRKIETTKFIKGKFISVYETCKALITDNWDFELYITSRNSDDVVCEPYEDYFYTFLDGELYQLTKVSEPPLNYLITTLVYEAMRHDWDDPVCKLHRDLIAKIEPRYKNFTLDEFKNEIERIERDEGDFFGEYISDDSDSDNEHKYQLIPQRQKHLRLNYAQTLFKRAQPEKLIVIRKTREPQVKGPQPKKLMVTKKTRELRVKDPVYEIDKRQQIVRDAELEPLVSRDLERLNALALTGELNAETIKTITTKFCVAQYRGVTYRTDEWNKPSRKQHREAREERFPLFSRAVIEKVGYATYGEFFARREIDKVAVVNVAEKLHDQLLRLKSSGPVKLRLIGRGETYLYGSALLALQDLYTKSYDKFHEFLRLIAEKFLVQNIPVDQLKDAIGLSIGEHNPFVSTADTPDHALRYAYGDKFYEGHQEKRLRPRWRKNGRAERPYSGKVYISLHDPLELFTKAHNVVSLNAQGALHIDHETITEKETSFFAYIPEGKVVSQHVAKFPSFNGEYKEIYLEKYGLTKDLYGKFKARVIGSPPHSTEAKNVKELLTEHLISFQEVSLIEEAKIAAENQGGVLVYRNEHGGFSLYPSESRVVAQSVGQKRKAAAEAIAQQIKTKRAANKQAEMPATGFLSSLVSRFSIFSYKHSVDSLVRSLSLLLEVDAVQIQPLRATNPDDEVFLKAVAEQHKVKIFLHDAEAVAGVKEINSEASVKHINLYYQGGGQYAALRPKDAVLNPPPSENQDDDNDAFQLGAS